MLCLNFQVNALSRSRESLIQFFERGALVHQNDWFSSDTGIQYGPDKPAYIVGKVKKGALTWERVLLDTFYPENK